MARITGQTFLDQAALRRALIGPSGEVTRLVARTTRNVLTNAKLGAPVDTGFLRMNHRAGDPKISGMKVSQEIIADTEYALYVHEGHGVITPKNGKFLRFTVGKGSNAQVVFAKSVRAQPPRPWLKNALEREAGRSGFLVQ